MNKNWKFEIPAYPYGILDPTLYSCGYGYEVGMAEEQSYLHLITNTTAPHFQKYLNQLALAGCSTVFENRIDGNRYASCIGADGETYYLYYMQETDATAGTVRVIRDCSSNVSLKDFCYHTEGSSESEFYMFNMNYPNEDTFLIRTADNAWIVIDGGITGGYGGVDPDGKYADALFSFMWEKSGLQQGEKLTISCWYLSHAHRDHFLAFESLIKNHHDRIDLQRILANVPDTSVVYNSNNTQFVTCMEALRTYFPHVAYLKAHTGMEIRLADVSFTVLTTQEDLVDFWVKNKEVYNTYWKHYSDLDSSDENFLIYRNSYKLYDFNNSSIISKIDINGLSVLEMGDGYRADRWMIPYYSMQTLTTDILKVAHHFNNPELIGFYTSLTDQGYPMYALVSHGDFCGLQPFDTAAKQNWYRNLGEGQYFLVGSYYKIYGFRKASDGTIVKRDYDATYSYMATQVQ